jgi:hypothetical protein
MNRSTSTSSSKRSARSTAGPSWSAVRQIETPTELPSQIGFTTQGNPKSPWIAARSSGPPSAAAGSV